MQISRDINFKPCIFVWNIDAAGGIASLAGKPLDKPVVVKIACGGISIFSKLPLGWLAKRFVKWADVYVSLSKQIDEELIVSGFAKNKIIRLPNGFDTSAFPPLDNLVLPPQTPGCQSGDEVVPPEADNRRLHAVRKPWT